MAVCLECGTVKLAIIEAATFDLLTGLTKVANYLWGRSAWYSREMGILSYKPSEPGQEEPSLPNKALTSPNSPCLSVIGLVGLPPP